MVNTICLSKFIAMPYRASRRNNLNWGHQAVHFWKISPLLAKTWSQNDLNSGERGCSSWRKGWLSEVNLLKEKPSIKVREVTCLLGLYCKRRELMEKLEEQDTIKMAVIKSEGLDGLFIVAKRGRRVELTNLFNTCCKTLRRLWELCTCLPFIHHLGHLLIPTHYLNLLVSLSIYLEASAFQTSSVTQCLFPPHRRPWGVLSQGHSTSLSIC